jgi:hypothetical protein
MRATCPAHFILLDLMTLKYSVKNRGSEFNHYAIFSTIRLPPFEIQISSTLCSQNPSVCVPPFNSKQQRQKLKIFGDNGLRKIPATWTGFIFSYFVP